MQYNLQISKEQYMLITCSIVTALLILGFTFGDAISDWKERLKAKVRKWLHDKILGGAIDGESANTSVGFVAVLVKFLDEHFLKPSDEISIHLNEVVKEDPVQEQEEDDDDDNEEEDNEEEEEEDEDNEDEEEEEEEEFTVVDNEAQQINYL